MITNPEFISTNNDFIQKKNYLFYLYKTVCYFMITNMVTHTYFDDKSINYFI